MGATSTEQIVQEEVSTTTTVLNKQFVVDFPPLFLTDSADLDTDSLTDMEEEIFDTDSGIWDTDGDGYYDGQEVFNLYNPKGAAPMRIIDSGLVLEYVNPIRQYRTYYPASWQVGSVDSSASHVLLSAATGDFISVSAFTKGEKETFEDWFAREAEGQQYADLKKFVNRFQEEGLKRKDDLVAYFMSGNDIYILSYHPGTSGFVPFRHLVQMLYQSFRPSKTAVEIPLQPVLPPEPEGVSE